MLPTGIALWRVFIGLLLFIAGLFTMRAGLKTGTSRRTEQVISKLVKTPWRGLLTGIAATMVTQSSAAVTVISMGLVSASILTFPDTIGVILGTNIGSTFTVGLLTLDLERFGPYIVALALLLFLASALFVRKNPAAWRALRAICISLAGFGTLFIGFGIMSSAASSALASTALRSWVLIAAAHPLAGVLVGTLITALIGSSSASTALTLTLAQTGALPLPAAISIVFGNNIGTCLTAVLASIGGGRAVQRVAATHVLLNVGGALLFLPFLLPFSALLRTLSPSIGVQVALAHVLFNVTCSLAALPFAAVIARGITRLLP